MHKPSVQCGAAPSRVLVTTERQLEGQQVAKAVTRAPTKLFKLGSGCHDGEHCLPEPSKATVTGKAIVFIVYVCQEWDTDRVLCALLPPG
jgi:hypothetical protein